MSFVRIRIQKNDILLLHISHMKCYSTFNVYSWHSCKCLIFDFQTWQSKIFFFANPINLHFHIVVDFVIANGVNNENCSLSLANERNGTSFLINLTNLSIITSAPIFYRTGEKKKIYLNVSSKKLCKHLIFVRLNVLNSSFLYRSFNILSSPISIAMTTDLDVTRIHTKNSLSI